MEGDFMGKKLTVKITEAGKHYMKCKLLNNSKANRPDGVPEPLELGQLSGVGDSQCAKGASKIEQAGHGHHPLLVISLFVLVTSLLLRLYYSMTAINTT